MAPTGILRRTSTGIDLEISRTISAPVEDVWSSLTDSDRTALWFGPWERGVGNSIRVQMAFEEGTAWMDMQIEVCEPPKRLVVSTGADVGDWHLEAVLVDTGATTTLTLIQHCANTEGIGEIGPGWEYYLDMMLASRTGAALPSFDDYYPGQQGYYESLSPR